MTTIPQPQHTLRGRQGAPYLADVEGHGIRGPLLPDDVEGHGFRGPLLPNDDVEGHGFRAPLLPEEDVEAHGKMSGLVADGKYTGLAGEVTGRNFP